MDQLRAGTLTIEKWKAEQQLPDATWPTERSSSSSCQFTPCPLVQARRGKRHLRTAKCN